ncbi:hypothetical protein [Streptomyces sp. NPDC056264]|uniref:hypothetical protein n=1 Tax=Streptomyces sp. NPDC056264 TaxID=3345767 RepID=UPI003AABA75B
MSDHRTYREEPDRGPWKCPHCGGTQVTGGGPEGGEIVHEENCQTMSPRVIRGTVGSG